MINNSNFILPEIPNYHPIFNKYDRLDWWKEQKRRCIEGYWVSGKWMPPELYYYVNFHTIIHEDDISRSIGRPWLRDIDWEQAYLYTEATGFSGFELDDKYTCDRRFGPEKEGALKYGWITQEELDTKVYVEAREYLRKIHNRSLGKALYKNPSKNIIELASRGYGKSYGASGRITHNFLFDGARDYDEYLRRRRDNNPFTSETVVGAIDAKYSGDLLGKVKVGLKYLPGSYEMSSGQDIELYPSPLSVTYTGSIAPGRNYTTTVSESKLYHRTFQDNPFAANGTRPNRVFIDEVGFMNNLLETLGAVEATQASADFKRLCMYGMGTGGLTTGGAAMYAHEIFYNPEQYNCLAFDDEWENKGKICYFVPAYKALNKFKEGPNKISNEQKALEFINEERESAKKATSRTKLQTTIINKPIKPSEIFLRVEGGLFPAGDLNGIIAELEANYNKLKASYKVSRLDIIKNEIVPVFSDSKPFIREFPAKRGMDLDAAIEIWDLPNKDGSGEVYSNRYIAGWDPVEVDGNDDITQSLQSLYIMDNWTGILVAEYTARTYLAEDYFEQARRLLLFYKATCNYENNIKGPYTYFRNKNSLHLLAETPETLKDTNLLRGSTIGNKSLGTRTNEQIIDYANSLILQWLETPAYNYDDGTRNMDLIYSLGLLKELVAYTKDINTDRISALGMLLILREDKRLYTDIRQHEKVKSISDDDFWNRAYKRGKSNYINLSKLSI